MVGNTAMSISDIDLSCLECESTSLPSASVLNHELQSVLNLTGLRPMKDDYLAPPRLAPYRGQMRRPFRRPPSGVRAVNSARLEKDLSECYTLMLQQYDKYLAFTDAEMQEFEIENALLHKYNEDAMDMISNADLSVWQILQDMTS